MHYKLRAPMALLPITVNGHDRIRVTPQWRGYRTYEPEVWSRFLDEVREGDVVIDVGANVGFYAVAAAQRGGRVVAFEPDPTAVRALRRHIRLNRVRAHIDVVPALVGADDGAGVLAQRERSFVSSAATLYLSAETSYRVVPRVSLDSALAEHAAVAVLKIDVEGYELAVLRGARKLLAEKRPRLIMVEVHPWELSTVGASLEEVAHELAEAGYQVEKVRSESDAHEHWLARPS